MLHLIDQTPEHVMNQYTQLKLLYLNPCKSDFFVKVSYSNDLNFFHHHIFIKGLQEEVIAILFLFCSGDRWNGGEFSTSKII